MLSVLKVKTLLVSLLIMSLCAAGNAYPQENESSKVLTSLSMIFDTGMLLLDTNEDGVIDDLNMVMILPQNSDNTMAVAAANVSARFGYESSGLDMDYVQFDNEMQQEYEVPVVIFGSNNIAAEGYLDAKLQSRLNPGQGAISLIEPDEKFQKGGLILSSADATGLIAVSNYFSARFPSIWDVNGKFYSNILESLRKYIDEKLEIESSIKSLVVSNNSLFVVKIAVDVTTKTDSDIDIIKAALTKDKKKKNDEDSKDDEGDKGDKGDKKPKDKLKDLKFTGLNRIEFNISTSSQNDRTETVNVVNEKPDAEENKKAISKSYPDFSLSELYSINGIYKDTNKDFVPDETSAVFYVSDFKDLKKLNYFAARIGLETAGANFPLFKTLGELDNPESVGFPVVIGADSYTLDNLKNEKAVYGTSDKKGEGYIQYVKDGFNGKSGLIVSGADSDGLSAIIEYISNKLPYLDEFGKGNFELGMIEKDVDEFVKAKNASGQAALAIFKLEEWLERLGEDDIEDLSVEIAAGIVPEGLEKFISDKLKNHFPNSTSSVKLFKTGFGANESIFDDSYDIPWEVDDFWSIFNESILPGASAGDKVTIDLRVSESPEIRAKLKLDILVKLKQKGIDVDGSVIRVLSAYKQGYSWLYDDILPKLKDKKAKKVTIKYHNLKDSEEIRWQSVYSNTRWLQEIYPVDALMAKELKIDYDKIVFEPTVSPKDIYTVTAVDKKGKTILEETFDPKYVVRPFFDIFPEYENVRVTTGWIQAEVNGRPVADERIVTDPEKMWDILQTKVFRKMIDYTMNIQDGRPSSLYAPYFDEFRTEISMSEPNYRIGLDEEVISSLEALHEDIYFETLTLYNLLGGRYGAGSMNYPGRILPYITPNQDGKPGKVRFTLTGKEKGVPQVVLTYKVKGKESVRKKYILRELSLEKPKFRGVKVVANEGGLDQLFFEIEAHTPESKYEEMIDRSNETSIDRTFISAEKMQDMIGILSDLHSEGLYTESLNYDKVKEIFFRITAEDSTEFFLTKSLLQNNEPKSTILPKVDQAIYNFTGQEIVQWETPINLTENNSILGKLNNSPNLKVYFVSKSFLGQDIFAVDAISPYRTKYISQAKLNALKPTLFVSGRQHANEVSSTSHILKLLENIATDDEYSQLLKNVNLVTNPITNADGAQLGFEMQKINPDFMFHAAYLGPLGVDIDADSRSRSPRYPESQVRGKIREAWLPDIYINMHGYPSHEWVQYFAGYSAWVRNRNGGQRSWWAPRGWFIPSFRWIEDDKYPKHKTASFEILEVITKSISENEAMMDINKRQYEVYRKYRSQEVDEFGEYFRNGVLVNTSLKGSKMSGNGVSNPKITYFSVTTEAPDETARGEWMKKLAGAGLAHSTAVLKYLNSGENEVKKENLEYSDRVIRKMYRIKPVLPKKEK